MQMLERNAQSALNSTPINYLLLPKPDLVDLRSNVAMGSHCTTNSLLVFYHAAQTISSQKYATLTRPSQHFSRLTFSSFDSARD